MPRQKAVSPLAQNPPNEDKPDANGRGCQAFINRKQSYCGKPTVPGKKVCTGHGGLSTGPRTPEGLERLAASKRVHGRETRALRFRRSQISYELRQKEEELYAIGMIHGPRTRGRKPSLWAQAGRLSEYHTRVEGLQRAVKIMRRGLL
jgi:hypothetical protein